MATVPPLPGDTTVHLPHDRAFRFFTESMGRWWPSHQHIAAADLADVVLEPRVDGRWFERGTDGSECDWGRVLVWEPPTRLVVTWQITGHWQYDPDPARASEVEVVFTADGPARTAVALEHRHLERLVEGRSLRDEIAGAGGWSATLGVFAKAAEAAGTGAGAGPSPG